MSYPKETHPDYCPGSGTITVPRPMYGPGSGNGRLTWCPTCGRPVGHTVSYSLKPHLRHAVRHSHDDGKRIELENAERGQREADAIEEVVAELENDPTIDQLPPDRKFGSLEERLQRVKDSQ